MSGKMNKNKQFMILLTLLYYMLFLRCKQKNRIVPIASILINFLDGMDRLEVYRGKPETTKNYG